MTEKFSLNNLSDTEFEEFCFDLLNELGFQNVDWRKGTGKTTSPSDSGRDIEAEKFIKDIDGEITKEKWFFQCKNYKKGVPPEKIQGALSWATAERPDKLVIAVSNFLSNPCKEFLKKYVKENKPFFKIKTWELKELEKLSFGKYQLLNKYGLSEGLDFVKIMHPLHLKYTNKPNLNTLDYFFSVLDEYNSKKRDKIFLNAGYFFIMPRFKISVTGKEALKELQIDDVSYESVKKKCYSLKNYLHEAIIVKSIVNLILEWTLHWGDKTSTDTFIKRSQRMVDFMKEGLEKKNNKGETDATLKRIIKTTEEDIEKIPKKTEYWYSLYTDFCEKVLSKLMVKDIMDSIKNIENED